MTNTTLHREVSKETRLWALVACHESDLPMSEIIAQSNLIDICPNRESIGSEIFKGLKALNLKLN